ncbi:MAG: hypothetical protein BGO25_08205 [Acidobacteriales bacterium 59-55]|nr:MAG: hypothetical protein BGO25_08205 [Acidobacteriales bacterium 59-55]
MESTGDREPLSGLALDFIEIGHRVTIEGVLPRLQISIFHAKQPANCADTTTQYCEERAQQMMRSQPQEQ